MYVDPIHRPAGYAQFEYFQPLFLYESLLNVASMTILLWAARHFEKRLKPGDIFYLYAILYAVIRFSLEFLRVDHIGFNQNFMVVVFVIAGGFFFWNHRPRRA
jgi:phosphatidylglycerol:prolipoprotein diacylglycerol transferase